MPLVVGCKDWLKSVFKRRSNFALRPLAEGLRFRGLGRLNFQSKVSSSANYLNVVFCFYVKMAHILNSTLQTCAKKPNHQLKDKPSALTKASFNHRRTSNLAEVPSSEDSATTQPKIFSWSNLLFEHWLKFRAVLPVPEVSGFFTK